LQKLPIILGIARSPGNSSFNSGTGASRGLVADVRQAILDRDNSTCRCCGFRATRYQDVLHVDRNVDNNAASNLVTVCQFCAQCFDLEQVVAMKSGFLIWLPEIDQPTLNHIARALYIARVSQGPMADAARRILDIIMVRREDAKRRLNTDDPFVLASVMRDFLTPKAYGERGDKLNGIRLFPLDRRMVKEGDLEFNQFPQILAYWRSKDGPFGGRLPAQWLETFKDMMRAKAA
jgi:intracellular multiplication protein IcmJ